MKWSDDGKYVKAAQLPVSQTEEGMVRQFSCSSILQLKLAFAYKETWRPHEDVDSDS